MHPNIMQIRALFSICFCVIIAAFLFNACKSEPASPSAAGTEQITGDSSFLSDNSDSGRTDSASSSENDDNYMEVSKPPVQEDTEPYPSGSGDSEEVSGRFCTLSADLTHNGTAESIIIDASNLSDAGEITLHVENEEQKILYTMTAGVAHVSWNSLYLCVSGENAYLLQYHPYMSNGVASYSYDLFYLGENGRVIPVSSDSVEFNMNFYDESSFQPQRIAEFTNGINAYLSQSIVLLSTQDGSVTYSTESNPVRRTEELSWLNNSLVPFSEGDSLLQKLEKYKAYYTAEQS